MSLRATGGKTLREIHEGGDVRIGEGEQPRDAVRLIMVADPPVSITVENDAIAPSWASPDSRGMDDALLCALLNERLLAANADHRRSVMRELLA